MTFGKRLASLRKEKGISQRELADLFNISQSTIAYYEKDKKEPNKDTLKRLATYFDVTIDYILGTSDIRKIIQEEQGVYQIITDNPDGVFKVETEKRRELTSAQREAVEQFEDYLISKNSKEKPPS